MKANEAKKILPKSEYETFESIFLNQISRTARSTLMQKVTLARRLRDKYRDLAHRQVVETKTRLTNETDTGINNRRVRLMQEVIEKLEDVLGDGHNPPPSRRALKQEQKKASMERTEQSMRQEEKKLMLDARRRTR